MHTQVDKKQKQESQLVPNTIAERQLGSSSTFQFVDDRPESIAQRKLQEVSRNSQQVKQAAQLQALANQYVARQQEPVQKLDPQAGFPDRAKAGKEDLSGGSHIPVQRSILGKVGTLLGAGVATTAAALAGPAIFGAGVAASAVTGLSAYVGHKLLFGGPFLGGGNNIDILQAGKGQRGTLGIGYMHKKGFFSHVVIYIDGMAFHQVLMGDVGNRDISKTLVRPVGTEAAETEFEHYEGFDPGRGRLVSINVPINVSAKALSSVNRKFRTELGQYGLLANSCASNVASVLKSAGLAPPSTAVTPSQLWMWMHGLHQIQSKLA